MPFFCGFYESHFYNGDTLYNETYGDELDFYKERFGDNTFDYWYDEFQKDEPYERYISSIIQYMMEDADKDVYDHVICGTLENIYLSEYIINAKEKKSSN